LTKDELTRGTAFKQVSEQKQERDPEEKWSGIGVKQVVCNAQCWKDYQLTNFEALSSRFAHGSFTNHILVQK
jgi:hypothetical protein